MLYKLGDIVFEPLTGPSSFSRSEAVNVIEKPRLEGKPTLEMVGGILTRIELRIRLHWQIQNVQGAIRDLRDAMIKGDPMAFIRGTGYSEGDYVLTSLDITVEKTDGEGRLMLAEANIRLLEYVTENVESSDAIAARKKAFATIEAKPILVNPKPQFQSPQSLTMRNITSSAASARSASAKLKKAQALPALAKKYMDEANRGLARAKQFSQDAKAGVDAVAGKISNAVALKARLDEVVATIDSIKSDFTEVNLPNIRTLSFGLDRNISNLMSASAELTNITALRK